MLFLQASDHMMDRFAVTEMLCMGCGSLQPLNGSCANASCRYSAQQKTVNMNRNRLSHYFCDVCALYDDDSSKSIYHCPFCNVCRAGRGLGIDFRHCMRCNACVRMDREHTCILQSLQGACPICLEEVFNSRENIKVCTTLHRVQ